VPRPSADAKIGAERRLEQMGTVTEMNWDDLARRMEGAEDSAREDSVSEWKALFAAGGTYQDPVNPPTNDLDSIAKQTEESLPDWSVEFGKMVGDDRFGAAEWIGRGTLLGEVPIELHGCAFVEVDKDGLIVRWRDYFDLKEIETQATAAFAKASEALEDQQSSAG